MPEIYAHLDNMGFLDFFKPTQIIKQITVYENYDNMLPVRTVGFDGEKTQDELGDVLNVVPQFTSLRLRSHEADLKSDVVKIITNKFFKWIIGKGLKLQAEPVEEILQSVTSEQLSQFRKAVEPRFNLWAKSKHSDYTHKNTLHNQANNALKSSFLGGDALVVLRIENGELNIQIIDGQHVQTPYLDSNAISAAEKLGNTISHGIEKDSRGRHVAFHVKTQKRGSIIGAFVRIPVYGTTTKRKLAWMIYFDKHRIDHDRGIGALTSVLEKIEKLDRYTEATVGSAEERAKLLYTIIHNQDSTGENPIAAKIRSKMGGNNNDTTEDSYSQADKTARNIKVSTSKEIFNMPIGSKVEAPSMGNIQQDYPEFFRAVFNCIAAAVDIPPEVALQLYSSNYSASRAAINGWQHLMDVYREKFTDDFYKPIYEIWLEIEVMKSHVQAPNYLSAITRNDWFFIEAFSHCRFTGANIPHIDPLKEVKAVRAMLGDAEANTPLISREQASERLNTGAWDENYKKLSEEKKILDNGTTNS